jgi:hypothetical protein
MMLNAGLLVVRFAGGEEAGMTWAMIETRSSPPPSLIPPLLFSIAMSSPYPSLSNATLPDALSQIICILTVSVIVSLITFSYINS